MKSTIQSFVLERLEQGWTIDQIWSALDRLHWNYISRIHRGWLREQKALQDAINERKEPG